MSHRTETRKTRSVERNNELISALVDGEHDTKSAAFLIRRLSDDPQMHRQWQRFHLVRACLQREFSGPVALVERVQSALRDESAPERAGRFQSLMRLGVGGAVAASVAIVAVLGLSHRIDSENAGGLDQTQAPGFVSQSTALDRQFNAPLVPAGFGAGTGSTSGAETDSSTHQRINRYMIRHSQAAGRNGFISLTPVLTAPAAAHPLGRKAKESAERIGEGSR